MGNNKEQIKRLCSQREKIAKGVNLTEMIRGSLLKRYLTCTRSNCKCHKSEKHRHGPHYFLSIRRKNKSSHVYIPQNMQDTVKQWVNNYNKTWAGIEGITDINVKLIRLNNKKNG